MQKKIKYTDKDQEKEMRYYVHVFDGGIYDNLGLETVKENICRECSDKDACNYDINLQECLNKLRSKYKNIIVILVDAFTELKGISDTDCNPRSIIDYFVDFNFLYAYGGLLATKREIELEEFNEYDQNSNGFFIFSHLTFDDIKDDKLKKDVGQIPTNFYISEKK